MLLPELSLLTLRFKCIQPINDLPFFHGPLWSALLRAVFRTVTTLCPGVGSWIAIHSVEMGVCRYGPGDPVHVGFTTLHKDVSALLNALGRFDSGSVENGKFALGMNLEFQGAFDRIRNKNISLENPKPAFLSASLLEEEITEFMALDEFRMILTSPLRLPRPSGQKEPGHRFCDEPYFFKEPDSGDRILFLASRVRGSKAGSLFESGPVVSGGAATWVDLPYGQDHRTTLGGLLGTLRISGRPTRTVAEALVLGKYLGAGKNKAFGLGFYDIPELADVAAVFPVTRGKTLFERAVSEQALSAALEALPQSSPGEDGISLEDMKKAGAPPLKRLAGELMAGQYRHEEIRRYSFAKKSGGQREIAILNIKDRIVHKALAGVLQPVAEAVLSDSSYAYRRGLSRKGAVRALLIAFNRGYSVGFKADVESFFPSVQTNELMDLVTGILGNDPVAALICDILQSINSMDVSGLAQGSSLSPVLSNLYLDRFDKEMESAGFRLVRFGDDFVILARDETSGGNVLDSVSRSLARFGLTVKEEKSEAISSLVPFHFLGLVVDSSGYCEAERSPGDDVWLPVFKERWKTGNPIYLTCISRGAFSSGPDLVINHDNNETTSVPWSRVSRIVVVGRASFSSGLVRKVIAENIPVSFVDILGRARGRLQPELCGPPSMRRNQVAVAEDKEYRLAFAREIVRAKILNSMVVLRRNKVEGLDKFGEYAARCCNAKDAECLRGIEGSAARGYFEAYRKLVEPFPFEGRSYRPPEGPVNAMLSFGYTLMYNRVAGALHEKGFDPRMGLFHVGRGRHAALASDLMEELRHVVDRVVLGLIHKKEIQLDGFTEYTRYGRTGCRLDGQGFRAFIHRFEKTMAAQFTPQKGGRMSCNSYLDEMADSLRRSMKLGIPYKALRIR